MQIETFLSTFHLVIHSHNTQMMMQMNATHNIQCCFKIKIKNPEERTEKFQFVKSALS